MQAGLRQLLGKGAAINCGKVMTSIFDSENLLPYLKAAQSFTKLVALRSSSDALPDLSGEGGLLGDEFGAVTPALPLTRFGSVEDVERLANDLELVAFSGPIRTHEEMYGVFYELALNAVQHSESAVGCDAIVAQGVDAAGHVLHLLGVADCGIGIRATLIRNPDFAHVASDADAIALATELHVTGTGDSSRGLGLDHVMNVVRIWRCNCIIISGSGYLNIVDGVVSTQGNLDAGASVNGTVVAITLSM